MNTSKTITIVGGLIAIAFATLGTGQSASAATKVVYNRNNVVVSSCRTSTSTKFFIRNYSGTSYGTIGLKTSYFGSVNWSINTGKSLPAYYGNITVVNPVKVAAGSLDVAVYNPVTKSYTTVVARFNFPGWSGVPVC